MTLHEAKEIVADIKKRYGITHFKCIEDGADGEVKFVDFNIRFKIDKEKKILDFPTQKDVKIA